MREIASTSSAPVRPGRGAAGAAVSTRARFRVEFVVASLVVIASPGRDGRERGTAALFDSLVSVVARPGERRDDDLADGLVRDGPGCGGQAAVSPEGVGLVQAGDRADADPPPFAGVGDDHEPAGGSDERAV